MFLAIDTLYILEVTSLERDSTEAAEIFEKLCASFQVIRKASAMPVEKAILPTADSKMSKPR